MVATFKVMYDFGGTDGTPGTEQDTAGLGPPNVRFKTEDDATIDTANPIPIPSSGAANLSYWKQVYLEVSEPPDTQVDNIKIYTDASGFGTGISTFVGDETPTKNSGADTGYKVATGTAGVTGTSMVSAGVVTGSADFYSFTSAAAKTVSISEAGAILNATGEMSNYVALQVAVATTASPGDLANETITFQYDEI